MNLLANWICKKEFHTDATVQNVFIHSQGQEKLFFFRKQKHVFKLLLADLNKTDNIFLKKNIFGSLILFEKL
jgi:hypothetical protein